LKNHDRPYAAHRGFYLALVIAHSFLPGPALKADFSTTKWWCRKNRWKYWTKRIARHVRRPRAPRQGTKSQQLLGPQGHVLYLALANLVQIAGA
jgi:hypothetical protein